MDNAIFKKMFKMTNYDLYSRIYEVRYTCFVPKATTIHDIERNLAITPILSLNNNDGYGFYGEDNVYGTDVSVVVDGIFETFEDDLKEVDYGLNNKVEARITIYEMSKLYDEGNYVYIKDPEMLRVVYGLLEAFVEFKLKFYKGPNTGNGLEEDDDLVLLDALATSMTEVYKENDKELYYYVENNNKGRRRLTNNLDIGTNEVTIRTTGNKVVPKVSMDKLKRLGLA